MIRRPPRSTQSRSSAASDVYKRQVVERRTLPTGLTRSQLAFQATRALMEGPTHPSLVSPLPGTDVLRGVTVSGRTASVDFEESVLKLSMGAQEEEQVKNSLVLTLTRLAGVSRVRLLVGGNNVEGLFGHVDTVDPLFRLDGRLEEGTALAVYSLTEVDGDQLPVLTVYQQKQALMSRSVMTVSYTHLRAHETRHDLVCRLLL